MHFRASPNYVLSALGFMGLVFVFIFSFFFNGLGEHFNHLLFIYSVLFLATLLIIVDRSQKPKTLKGKRSLILLMLIYVVWLVLEPYLSTWFGLSRLIAWILLLTPVSFLLASYLVIDRLRLKLLIVTYFSFGSLMFFVGMLHFYVTRERPDGPLRDANVYAGFLLLLLLPVVVYLLVNQVKTEKQKRINGYLFLYIFFGFAAFFTAQSRSANVAVMIVAACLLAKVFREFKFQPLKNFIVLGLVLMASYQFSTSTVGSSYERVYTDFSEDTSVHTRLLLWKTSLDIYKEHPVSGVGLGQFKHFYRQQRSPDDILSSGNFAHNDYLQFLLEGGLIQGAFIVALSIYIIVLFLRSFFSSQPHLSNFARMQVFLAICMCCIFFLQALVNFIFYVPACAITIGLLLAFINRRIDSEDSAAESLDQPSGQSIKNCIKNPSKMPAQTLILSTKMIVLTVFISLFALSTLATDSYVYAKYEVMPGYQEDVTAVELYAQSHKLVWLRPNIIVLRRYQFLYALNVLKSKGGSEDVNAGEGTAVHFTESELAEVEVNLQAVLRLNPADATSLQFLADLAENHESVRYALSEKYPQQALYRQSAAELYEASLASDPTLLANYFRLHAIYKQTRGRQAAYDFLKSNFATRTSFGEFSMVQQFRTHEKLLDDAIALGLKDEAEKHAKIVFSIDTCNKQALALFDLEAPEVCQ